MVREDRIDCEPCLKPLQYQCNPKLGIWDLEGEEAAPVALEKQARQTNKIILLHCPQLARLVAHALTPLVTSYSIVYNHENVLWKALYQRGRLSSPREFSPEHISLILTSAAEPALHSHSSSRQGQQARTRDR